MNARKIIATIFIFIALVLGFIFYSKIEFPLGLEAYLKKTFYSQFGPLAICVELVMAGYYLYIKHRKTNFALALFAFTALLDPIFNTVGLFTSNVPIYAMVLFVICAFVALWLAFSWPWLIRHLWDSPGRPMWHSPLGLRCTWH